MEIHTAPNSKVMACSESGGLWLGKQFHAVRMIWRFVMLFLAAGLVLSRRFAWCWEGWRQFVQFSFRIIELGIWEDTLLDAESKIWLLTQSCASSWSCIAVCGEKNAVYLTSIIYACGRNGFGNEVLICLRGWKRKRIFRLAVWHFFQFFQPVIAHAWYIIIYAKVKTVKNILPHGLPSFLSG